MSLVELANCIKRLVRVTVQSGGLRRALIYFQAERLERHREFGKAEMMYSSVLNELRSKQPSDMFKVIRFWQYYAERAAVYAGLRATDDPLFHCRVRFPSDRATSAGSGRVAGQFEVEWSPLGLRLDGFLYRRNTGKLWVVLDGKRVRSISVRQFPLLPGFFNFFFMRDVVRSFPKQMCLELRTESGDYLSVGNHVQVVVETPHGTGELARLLEDKASISKKGSFTPTREIVTSRQNRFLELYTRVNSFYEARFGRSLFILYGTLLGFYRDGDFIPGDDDFDAGYISLRSTAIDVKSETIDMVKELVLAGFMVNFNRLGRLFRIRLPEDPPEIHLDLRPLWYEDGGIWAHLQAFLPLMIEDFLPLSEGRLRGVPVKYPRDAGKFLAAYYGPGWKVPDPGYSNASKRVPRFVRRKLASVCLSPREYLSLKEQLEEAGAGIVGVGKLISNGSHDLYPLSTYEAECEW